MCETQSRNTNTKVKIFTFRKDFKVFPLNRFLDNQDTNNGGFTVINIQYEVKCFNTSFKSSKKEEGK